MYPCSASVRAAAAVRGAPPDGLRPCPLRPDGVVRSDPEQPVRAERRQSAAELHRVSACERASVFSGFSAEAGSCQSNRRELQVEIYQPVLFRATRIDKTAGNRYVERIFNCSRIVNINS